MSIVKDMTGMRYGKLLVISRSENTNNGQAKWNCICDCGNKVSVRGADLRFGKTKSCGCRSREITIEKNTKHGLAKTRLYNVWCGIKQRCNFKNHISYKYYGGRGIKVCKEWESDFEQFKKWSYENGYDETAKRGICTIDRINVDGDYCPENCRWVDMKVQQNNHKIGGYTNG